MFSQDKLKHLYIVKIQNILSQWLALEFLLGDSSFGLGESVESCLGYKRDSEYMSINAIESLLFTKENGREMLLRKGKGKKRSEW